MDFLRESRFARDRRNDRIARLVISAALIVAALLIAIIVFGGAMLLKYLSPGAVQRPFHDLPARHVMFAAARP